MSEQDNRFVSVTTPLGTDYMLFASMRGTEDLSRLFEYELDLLVDSKNISSIASGGFPIEKVLGEAMTVTLALPSGGSRYFHGLVTQLRHVGSEDEFYLYRVVLRPWLWFLTRTSNCRIFQDLSVPDIIKKIFSLNNFSDFEMDLSSTYKTREYCVQYRESDFNFVSRLMEHEGIFYYFTHENSKHSLVIADSINAYQTTNSNASIPYYPPENTGQRAKEHIFGWRTSHSVKSGTYVLNDYDFINPKSNLVTKYTSANQHSKAEGEHYDYPGSYIESSDGEAYANIRLDELKTDYEVIQGEGNARSLTTGMLFILDGHYISSENVKHIVVSSEINIVSNEYRTSKSSEGTKFECAFKAIRATQQFRPKRLTPVPFVQGPQTATVVGKDGEEIWTDQYGRIKVQFHWERDGKKNETSSCWMRVAFPVAGKGWGWVSLPRIGQEVVISFLEGNPDKPLITGSVYNGDNPPPYELPTNQTQSGIKSRSSKTGTGENFNEIRFEDKKDSEEVYVHAEKDFNCIIENNETRQIGVVKKDKGDQTIEIQNDRTITLNQGNDTLHVKNGNRESNIDVGNHTLNVKQGNHLENVDQGNATLNVKLGNNNINVSVGDHIVKVDAGNAKVTAMQSIELKVGGSSIKMDPGSITIKAPMITIQADGMLEAKSPMTTVKGDGILILKGGITLIN